MPVWLEYADMPGFGAYARQWLAAQEEPVAADDKDEPWLLVDAIVQSSGRMLPLLNRTVHAVAGDSLAEAGGHLHVLSDGIAQYGTPDSEDEDEFVLADVPSTSPASTPVSSAPSSQLRCPAAGKFAQPSGIVDGVVPPVLLNGPVDVLADQRGDHVHDGVPVVAEPGKALNRLPRLGRILGQQLIRHYLVHGHVQPRVDGLAIDDHVLPVLERACELRVPCFDQQ